MLTAGAAVGKAASGDAAGRLVTMFIAGQRWEKSHPATQPDKR